MKNLFTLFILSFLIYSCSKDETDLIPENTLEEGNELSSISVNIFYDNVTYATQTTQEGDLEKSSLPKKVRDALSKSNVIQLSENEIYLFDDNKKMNNFLEKRSLLNPSVSDVISNNKNSLASKTSAIFISAQFHEHANFAGRAPLRIEGPIFSIGYPELRNNGWHDRISSFTFTNSSPSVYGMFLAEHKNYLGRRIFIYTQPHTVSRVSNLAWYQFNDITSSVFIFPC